MDTWLLLLVALVVAVVVFLWYCGTFSPLNIRVDRLRLPRGVVTIAYKFGVGPYKNVGPRFCDVLKLIPKDGAPSVGLYYDDPMTTPGEKCRSAVGVVVKAGETEYLTHNYVTQLENWGYKMFDMPEVTKGAVAEHPFTTRFSVMIAAMRVYGKLWQFIEDNKLLVPSKETPPVAIEIYTADSIQFCFPLENTKAYLVEEAQ